jgi:hypothetical protein
MLTAGGRNFCAAPLCVLPPIAHKKKSKSFRMKLFHPEKVKNAIYRMHSFPTAAETNCQKLGGLNNTRAFPAVLDTQNPKSDPLG